MVTRRFARMCAPPLAVAALLLPLVTTPAPAAAATPPELVDIAIAPAALSVTGLAVEEVVVSVRLTDDTGVVDVDSSMGVPGNDFPYVVLSRISGRGDVTRLGTTLNLASGTPTDGWWSGTVRVTSGADGHWEASAVAAYDDDGALLDVDPRTAGITRTLDVTGSSIPHLSMGQTPAVVRPSDTSYTLKGRLYAADTGVAFARTTITFGYDSGCADSYGDRVLTTNAGGYWHVTLPARGVLALHCVLFYSADALPASSSSPVALYAVRSAFPRFIAGIRATATRTAVPLGESTTVVGSVRPAAQYRIHLQRLVGDTWRTVSSATVRFTGRFTLAARPPGRGIHRYRVYLPGGGSQLPSSSRVVLIGAY